MRYMDLDMAEWISSSLQQSWTRHGFRNQNEMVGLKSNKIFIKLDKKSVT